MTPFPPIKTGNFEQKSGNVGHEQAEDLSMPRYGS